jgi:hypothetical protein
VNFNKISSRRKGDLTKAGREESWKIAQEFLLAPEKSEKVVFCCFFKIL